MRIVSIIIFLLLVGAACGQADQLDVETGVNIQPADAAKYIGEQVEVCGRVADTLYGINLPSFPTYLYFQAAPPEHPFEVVIRYEDLTWFDRDPPPHRKYKDLDVCVRGKMRESKVKETMGKPQIKAEDASQIRLPGEEYRERRKVRRF